MNMRKTNKNVDADNFNHLLSNCEKYNINHELKIYSTTAFLGSVNIIFNVFSFNWSKTAYTGTRPINSGIKPNFSKSSGCNFFNIFQ